MSNSSAEICRGYFEALDAHDLDRACAAWKPGAIDHIVGTAELVAPDGVRDFFAQLFAAVPDFRLKVVQVAEDGPLCAINWRMTGAFAGPGAFQGLEPTGASIDHTGIDLFRVENGLIVHNTAHMDGQELARQLGAAPPAGSKQEAQLIKLVNARTRLKRKLAAGELEPVADGVWLLRGGAPVRAYNVYLIEEEGGGICVYDAGIKGMGPALLQAAGRFGGINRIVLGHGHTDHRGAAPEISAPVVCHPDEVEDTEGSGGWRYWDPELRFLPRFPRALHKYSHAHLWDGGPVPVAGTVSEGDEVAGFKVVHLPGHAPGLIGLFRERDGLALVSDAYYVVDMLGRPTPASVPEPGYNYDTEQARQSILKLAELDPQASWQGHADPLTSDVRAQLLRAAEGSVS